MFIVVTFILLIMVQMTDSFIYPCSFAKCRDGSKCEAMETACQTPPCPLQAICKPNITSLINPCPFGNPILQLDFQPFYCGPGSKGRGCPMFSSCIVDPMGKFAVCCWSTKMKAYKKESMSSEVLETNGICPPIQQHKLFLPSTVTKECKDKCQTNDACSDRLRCCETSCGKRCVTPILPPRTFSCPLVPTASEGLCVENCTYDSDCKLSEKCCVHGCSYVCMSVQNVSKILSRPRLETEPRPGFCPPEKPVVPLECHRMQLCTRDQDCFGIRKCCYNEVCGYTCMNPKSRQLSVRTWLYQWRKDHAESLSRPVTVMIFLLAITLFLLEDARGQVYPCTVAKCAPGLACHAVEGSCNRPPCPLVARCLNDTAVIEPCPFGKPILQLNGHPFYCGRGPRGRICPRSTKCIIDPTNKFAVCCWNNHPEDDYPETPSMDVLANDGVCPPIPPPYVNGICSDQCESDNECLDGLKCCKTGCGRLCQHAEAPPPKFACPMPSINPFGPCVDVCTFESDCKPHERCCSNGCGHVCMTAQEASMAISVPKYKLKTRRGYCPPEKTIRYIECEDKEQCTRDADCFGMRKCCYNDQCGNICVNPKRRQLYVNSWLYMWKKKWNRK